MIPLGVTGSKSRKVLNDSGGGRTKRGLQARAREEGQGMGKTRNMRVGSREHHESVETSDPQIISRCWSSGRCIPMFFLVSVKHSELPCARKVLYPKITFHDHWHRWRCDKQQCPEPQGDPQVCDSIILLIMVSDTARYGF